jgi:DNA polymerase-3 subunit epsilon
MTIDFIAIDFETANQFRDSPCALGLVTVQNGRIVKEDLHLMRPPWSTGPEDFDDFNIAIHGITWELVENEPEFEEVWSSIYPNLDNLPLVAHNAAFDIGVLRESLESTNCVIPTIDFTCSLVTSRRLLDLPSYRLPFVAAELDIELKEHHNALEDARAASEVMIRLCEKASVDSLDGLLTALNVRWGRLTNDGWRGSTVRDSRRSRGLPSPRENADENHPLFGQHIVITGALPGSVSRTEAQDRIAYFGGIPQANVTKSTTMLVVGDINPIQLAPGATLSSKMAKVLKLQSAGQRIEIIAGFDFLPLLE